MSTRSVTQRQRLHAPGRFFELGTFHPPGAPERKIRAYIPSIVDPKVAHPLLVLLDGQNVFHDQGSFAGGWHAHDAVDRLVARTEHPPIVVAVENGGAHRIHEMGQDVTRFADAIANQLLPCLQRQLNVAGPAGRMIGGSSLGGLAALHVLLRHPQAFGGAMAMSPSLWFEGRSLLHQIHQGSVQVPMNARIYVDAGARERGRMFADAELLSTLLMQRGLPGDQLLWRPDQRGAHHERHWRRRLPKALRFLFRRA